MIAGLLLAASLLGPAQDEAARLAAQAQEAYKAEDYAEAKALVSRAYELDPRLEYLYALAMSERFLGECEAAVEHYRAFLAAHPPKGAATTARSHMQYCEEQLDHAPEPAANPDPDSDPEPEPEPVAPPPTVAPDTTPPPPDDRRPWHRDPAGGVLLGTGLALAVSGVTMYAVGAVRLNNPDMADDYRAYDAGITPSRTLGIAGIGIAAAGAALIIGAAIRYSIVRKRNRTGPP